ncbi:MAG: acetyltransferase [Rhodospirillaceae bacterium]|nr:acetyltransferase [Rhodospirillaceae bacterium]|tara:strand:- start:602 stop:1120 length:519 start_codon:yes stop_codon:yes gene_type:complete
MKVGKYTYGHNQIKHIPLRGGEYKIGKFCSIATNCKIYTGRGGHRKEFVSAFPFGAIHKEIFPNDFSKLLVEDKGNVIIGNDVWIGQNVTIMPGVCIGSGSIIANNSHVIKSCPAYSIIGGNPGKIIKRRFSESQIEKLLEIKWWDWDNARINRNLPLIVSSDIDRFIENYK